MAHLSTGQWIVNQLLTAAMNKEIFVNVLVSTMSADAGVRKQAEAQLKELECQAEATALFLEIAVDTAAPPGVQIAAAIFFKNRVANYWLEASSKFRTLASVIPESEKPALKTQLVQAMIQACGNTHIRAQLTEALQHILTLSEWSELLDVVMQLLGETTNRAYVTTGVLCLYQLVKRHRWASGASENTLNTAVTRAFPALEALAVSLADTSDAQSGELLYLAVKLFKFATYSQLPDYFRDPATLGRWFSLQTAIIDKPAPKDLMAMDTAARAADPRAKCIKWCFANIHRFQSRYGGGSASANADPQFAEFFRTHFVPEILATYWRLVEQWINGSVWLSEVSLYHLISFFEQLIDTTAFALLEPHLDSFLQLVVFKSLCATTETVELFETDPEEYIRRYYDMNREGNTADVAAGNFVYKVVGKRMATCGVLLTLVDGVFAARRADRASAACAFQTEGALRVLSAILFALEREGSPVRGQVDAVLAQFVVPELGAAEDFLTARACECVAVFAHTYRDEQVLARVFEGVRACFLRDDALPVQIEAADALRALVAEPRVVQFLAPDVPRVMEKFLKLNLEFESDILSYVMENFVEVFAAQLEPFAVQLAASLCAQFVKLASEIVETGDNDDKEYQALGVLNTLISMAISMNSSKEVTASLEATIAPLVQFVLDNAMVTFLPETMEFLESCNYASKSVTATGWTLFQTAMLSFQTYGMDYFADYVNYFESVINYGFCDLPGDSQRIGEMLDVCLNLLSTTYEDNPDIMAAYEILQFCLVTLQGKLLPALENVLSVGFNVFRQLQDGGIISELELNEVDFVKFGLAALYADARTTIAFLHQNDLAVSFFELWFNHSDDLDTVLGLKLQILATVNVVMLPHLLSLEPHLPQISAKLMAALASLPDAINRRRKIIARDAVHSEEYGTDADTFDVGIEELDAVKTSPIYDVNAVALVSKSVQELRTNQPERYTKFMASLSPEFLTYVNSLA
ncbi:hypothetical protein BABINDRAFT_159869 [Babjeviella inositovora NRRL Y-12698]|uniref:Importin N-terminal domain-containing protein n=1 Tax=Babjeviella inositovora NRRL Y-12698 TaxID=984486 RepID=A0A1E3QVA7_9ASCO|nr:uncharacterized protein BABINDRAFT_159869 [Babjeviella inositovora NRRL Y-12698]ODQ81596.1 hypothetical protein BABINDRAFT_159869 [Babjeviella inositovora NRRL Y-12698]